MFVRRALRAARHLGLGPNVFGARARAGSCSSAGRSTVESRSYEAGVDGSGCCSGSRLSGRRPRRPRGAVFLLVIGQPVPSRNGGCQHDSTPGEDEQRPARTTSPPSLDTLAHAVEVVHESTKALPEFVVGRQPLDAPIRFHVDTGALGGERATRDGGAQAPPHSLVLRDVAQDDDRSLQRLPSSGGCAASAYRAQHVLSGLPRTSERETSEDRSLRIYPIQLLRASISEVMGMHR
jgi:hypothetical protein